MWQLLLLFAVVVNGQNCSSDDTLCSSCAKIGSNIYTKSLYTRPFCSVLYEVGDKNSIQNTIDRCKVAFNSSFQLLGKILTFNPNLLVECQLPIFTDANLTGKYIDAGLRSSSWNYFIGITRGENCSSSWYFKAANGFMTWARNSSNSPCDVTQMAFEGMSDKEVNPVVYTTNSFLCQCALKVESLPGTSSGNIASFFYLILIFIPISFIKH